jgi:hypothetical protein
MRHTLVYRTHHDVCGLLPCSLLLLRSGGRRGALRKLCIRNGKQAPLVAIELIGLVLRLVVELKVGYLELYGWGGGKVKAMGLVGGWGGGWW